MTSWQGKALIAEYRIARRKRTFASARALRRSAESRQAEDIQLPGHLERRFRTSSYDVRGHHCYTLSPHRPRSTKHILYLHGGAYVHQVENAHWQFLERLVDITGATVSVPIYPLAPTYQYDTTLPMVRETCERTIGAERPQDQVIMGDSAGGALSLHLAQWSKQQHRPQPSRIVLISPWLDITITAPDVAALDRKDPFLSAPGLREAGQLYAGELDPHDPRVSPLYGDLEGLAPISLYTGSRDILFSDSRRLRQLTAEHGIAIDYEEYDGMFHGWILQDLPESHRATRQLAQRLAQDEAAGNRTSGSGFRPPGQRLLPGHDEP